MIYIDEVASLVCVEAYGGIRLVAAVVKVFAVVTVSKG
jgi:hypothetical protein